MRARSEARTGVSGPLRNWARTVEFAATRLARPASVPELQQVVAEADAVRAFGTGHSFNRLADTGGTLVSVADLDLPIELDEAARTVLVPAGARYGAVAEFLDGRGWALHNLASLPHISVAGACATGTHGSGVGNRCLPAAATSVEFVRGDGSLVTTAAGDADFDGSVLALGALGVATRVGLAIEPAYDVRQDVWLDLPVDRLRDGFDQVMSAGYSVSVFTRWSGADAVDAVWVKSRVDAGQVADLGPWARRADVAQHPIRGHDTQWATAQLGEPGRWHDRLPHFRAQFTPSSGDEQQSEYLLPRTAAAAAIEALRGLDLREVLQVSEIRAVAADDLWLSPFHGRDTVAFHFTWIDDDAAVGRAVDLVEQTLEGLDARPHWGKVFGARAGSDLARHYPRLADFRRLADEHDPDRKFGNDFLTRYVY